MKYLGRICNRYKSTEAGELEQTKAFDTSVVDFNQTPPRLRTLTPEKLGELGQESPTKKINLLSFLVGSALLLLALALLDTLFIDIKSIFQPDFKAKTYFENYPNPLNFSVLLSIASIFALIYTLGSINFQNARASEAGIDGAQRIFAIAKNFIELWPLIIASGLALEIQSFFGFFFPGITEPSAREESRHSVGMILLPFPANGWTPKASFTPFLVSCTLLLIAFFICKTIEAGRFVPKIEIEMSKEQFKSESRNFDNESTNFSMAK